MNVPEMKNRIRTLLRTLDAARRSDVFRPAEIRWKPFAYGEDDVLREDPSGWDVFPAGGVWGAPDAHFAFQADIRLPAAFAGREAVVKVATGATDIWNTDNPQMFALVNGAPVCAMDMNHHEVPLRPVIGDADSFRFGLHAYANTAGATNFLDLTVAIVHPEVEALYYDIKAPLEAASLMREDDENAGRMLNVLSDAVNRLDLRRVGSEAFHASVAACRSFLREALYGGVDPASDEAAVRMASSGIEARHTDANAASSAAVRAGIRTEDALSPTGGPSFGVCPDTRPPVVHSIGSTHIDVAWKWPLRQTREKAARSFSTVLALMDRYPEYRFMSSQPQLYQYVKEGYPELYARIRERVAEGRWETEGGMWLEADCNLTSGESLVRQIVHGKRFFRDEFGTGDDEVLWLPDVFGYSAALPQILRRAGIRYFMTTKIGWNDTNRIPADTLVWEGIDGSSVLSHFITTTGYQAYPDLIRRPVHNTTYNSLQNANHVMGTWQRYQNKDISRDVLSCFGYGDGGGGPTAAMLEDNRRLMRGLPGVPVSRITGVRAFFQLLERNLAGRRVPKWAGELYLEFHRGTYTSMARIKKANRRCEFTNLEAEFFGTLASALDADFVVPAERLDRMWKTTLLNQFHDILPGSSIGEVYEEAARDHAGVLADGERLIAQAQDAVLAAVLDGDFAEEAGSAVASAGAGGLDAVHACDPADSSASTPVPATACGLVAFNSLGFARNSLIELTGTLPELAGLTRAIGTDLTQITHDGRLLMVAEAVPAKGFRMFGLTDGKLNGVSEAVSGGLSGSVVNAASESRPCFTFREEAEGGWTLSSPTARIRLDADANIVSLVAFPAGVSREIVPAGERLNRLIAFEDRPAEFDAWNIDASYTERFWTLDALESLELLESGPVRMTVRIRRRWLDSYIEQELRLYAHTSRIDFRTTIDWNESQTLLKAAFPTNLMTRKATCEIQYGHVERPTHRNTSWDQARFEVCAHKWVDLSEDGFGVSLLNDARYGHDFEDAAMRLTLLKSGTFPYPEADRERHEFTYSLLPHEGGFREAGVVRAAYDLNVPLRARKVSQADGLKTLPSFSLVSCSADHVMVEVVKQAEEALAGEPESRRDAIVRLYEAHGRAGRVALDLSAFRPTAAWETDLLEMPLEAGKNLLSDVSQDGGFLRFEIRPFEIRTFRVRR